MRTACRVHCTWTQSCKVAARTRELTHLNHVDALNFALSPTTADPHSLSLFFSSSLNPGQCNATLFGFLVHYVEAATIIIALSLGALVAVFIAFCVRCGKGGGLRLNWCCRCGSCRDPGKSKEEQPFLAKRS